jgi:hypothetical protein
MNERIRELLSQAGIHYEVMPMNTAYEKFAELIVRECIRHFNEDYQRDFDTLWREDLTNSIKKHFGVE